MEATPAESNPHIIARTDGGGARTSGDESSSVANPRVVRTGATKETYSNEDWLSLASADPAFWLKGAITKARSGPPEVASISKKSPDKRIPTLQRSALKGGGRDARSNSL